MHVAVDALLDGKRLRDLDQVILASCGVVPRLRCGSIRCLQNLSNRIISKMRFHHTRMPCMMSY